MVLSTVVLLVVALHTLQAEDVNYKPRLTSEKVAGRITASTFVLEQPRCIFNEVVKPTDNVWLVVALSEAEDELPIPLSARELPYQSFGSNSSYMTLKTPVTNYPCPDPGEASEALTVLRVGSETGCITDLSWPDCNGPLPGPGPYKVKFVAMNSTQITAQSHWSDLITLRKGKDPNSINTQPARRSAGMIVITSVLSILFAILLAALITALVYKYSNICDGTEIMGTRDSATVTHYNSHHIYDKPAERL
ncbi:uroplakin-3b-like [Varanus komodoensis]|uniref:uroplakin-3b-like n=1 Tax=Varanus komodoensis TaxID=61221 RepID=UPI001CF79C58|nr:uroplakin-3b-like [Varanus komodoensis]